MCADKNVVIEVNTNVDLNKSRIIMIGSEPVASVRVYRSSVRGLPGMVLWALPSHSKDVEVFIWMIKDLEKELTSGYLIGCLKEGAYFGLLQELAKEFSYALYSEDENYIYYIKDVPKTEV